MLITYIKIIKLDGCGVEGPRRRKNAGRFFN